jgi:small subunit ribosomal protein S3Ae
MVKKTTVQDKKKKKWVPIFASKEFNNMEIGETFVEEAEQAMGRVVEVNLMMLTKDPKKQNFNVYFKIVDTKNNQANTALIAYQIQSAQLKKITKKSKNKVDDSKVYTTKDNIKVIIKPILITKALTYKSTLQELRKKTREFLEKYCKETNASDVLKDIVSGNLQREIKTQLKKILPVTNSTIKAAEILE